MHQIEPNVPPGMRLLPELPTLLDVYTSFGEHECVRFSRSFVQTLDIPEIQRDFLLWPGLPNSYGTFTLNLNWHPEIQFCIEDEQLRFAEFYRIFVSSYEVIFLERFTGFLWSMDNRDSLDFVASGLEQFFLLNILILKSGSFYDATQLDQEDFVLFDDDDGLDNDDYCTLALSLEPRFYQSRLYQYI